MDKDERKAGDSLRPLAPAALEPDRCSIIVGAFLVSRNIRGQMKNRKALNFLLVEDDLLKRFLLDNRHDNHKASLLEAQSGKP